MKAIQTTEVFDDWFVGLRDQQAKRRIQARIDRAEEATLATASRWARAFQKCGFTTGPTIARTLRSAGWK